MTYTIDFSGLAQEQKAAKAIASAEAYLGDRFTGTIEMFTQAIEAGEITTRRQVRLGMSFAGIQGYPVEALIEKYWQTLPA